MVAVKPKVKPHVTSALRTFASKIHPPLPRTPRESRQLQRMLDSSFRRQLDKQFPSPNTAPSTQHSDDLQSPRTRRPTPASAADNHFTSILSHPFFNVPPASSRAESSDHSKHASGDPMPSVASEHHSKKKPLDRLVGAMRSGTASVVTLNSCLNDDRASMRGLSEAGAVEHMRKSGLGAVVLSWFAAADSATRHRAFGSHTTIALLTPYLCSCGAQETAMTWLGDLLRESEVKRADSAELADPRVRLSFEKVLVSLLRSEIRYGAGVDSALRLLLRVCGDEHIVGPAGDSQPTPKLSWVHNAARYLTGCIMSLHTETGASAVSSELFDRFSSLFFQFDGDYTYKSLLSLYHPTHPDPGLALQFINRCSPDDSKPDQKLSSPISRMCIRAAEVCMQQDRNADAQRFLTFVKRIQMRDAKQSGEKARTQQAMPHDLMFNLLAPASG